MKRIKRAVAVLLAVVMVFSVSVVVVLQEARNQTAVQKRQKMQRQRKSGETNQVRMKFVEIRMVNTQLV